MAQRVLVDAARRLLLLFGVVGGVTLLGSLLLGAVAGASLRRSVALGFYLVGSVLLLAGFFVGNRGVLRARGEDHAPGGGGGLLAGIGRRGVRSATGDEQRESTHVSALVIGLGVAMLVLGVIADSDNTLA